MRSATDVAELEQIGYDVWRAPVVEQLAGWRLRFAHGLTGRANSVWTAADDGSLPLDEKVERAEAFYRGHDLAPRFQLTDASRPPGLEALLARRGYAQPVPAVSVETAELGEVADPGGVDVGEQLDDQWLALWAGSRAFDDLDVARALLTGSPGRTAFARVDDVAVGRAVAVDGWLGITSMATLPAARRRGHARRLLEALVAWGRAHGATHGLLQVDETNVPARALYARFGFRASHAYRYLVAP
jgi:ribosomal protein S18 acetylase RimI-like enzyme